MRWAKLGPLVLGLSSIALAEIGLTLKGNVFFRDGKIKDVIAPEAETYDEDGLNAWKDDAVFYVGDLYRQQGFFDALIQVDLKHAGGEKREDWHADVTIAEGKRYSVDTVEVLVLADTALPDSAQIPAYAASAPGLAIAAHELQMRRDRPYHEPALFADKRFLLRRYGNSGYVRAEVEDKVSVKSETQTVKIEYWIKPSYPVLFDTLMLANRRAPPADSLPGLTRLHLIRSLMPYERGDTVRFSDNDKWIAKLQYTGAFRYVRLRDSLLDNANHGSAILLASEERLPGHLRSSLFWESQYGPGISADARHSNIAGTLKEVRGGASLAAMRQNLYMGYGSPLLFGQLIRFDHDFILDYTQDKALHEGENLFGGDFRGVNSARLTWPWSYWLRLSSNVEIEAKSRILDSIGGRERSLNLNFIQTASLSFLNQAMDPSRGMRFALSWGNGGPLVQDRRFRFTEFRHNWYEAQTGYYYYFPRIPQIALALRLDGGRFFGEGGTNTDRFFLGGGRNVRSYDYQQLCPERVVNPEDSAATVCSNLHITAAYLLSSFEFRLSPFGFGFPSARGKWKALTPLALVPFVDLGKVWNVQEDFTLRSRDLNQGQGGEPGKDLGQGAAYGLGFRYPLLGIFNLRIDFAYRELGGDLIPDRFVVDLAQAF